MSEQQDVNSETTQNSNNDDKKKRWELLPKIKQGLDELSNQNKNNPKIKALQLALDKMINMKNHLSKQENDLKLGKLIALRERNAYLEKLRQIENININDVVITVDEQKNMIPYAVPSVQVNVKSTEAPDLDHGKRTHNVRHKDRARDKSALNMMQQCVVASDDIYEDQIIYQLDIFYLLFIQSISTPFLNIHHIQYST